MQTVTASADSSAITHAYVDTNTALKKASVHHVREKESDLSYLEVTECRDSNYLWISFKDTAPSYFSIPLINELSTIQKDISNRHLCGDKFPQFQVLSSDIPGVFSLGGDLEYFLKLIRSNDREGLEEYSRKTIDLIWSMATGHRHNLFTISVVNGRCLGGGFETALASDLIIASKDSRFAFPEISFNMFPGMGALSLLRRRVTNSQAKKIVMSGNTFTAQQMYDMGIVDIICDEEQIYSEVYSYMDSYKNRINGLNALKHAYDIDEDLSYEKLMKIGKVWVDAAFNLSERDLRIMELYVKSQSRLKQQVAV